MMAAAVSIAPHRVAGLAVETWPVAALRVY
jgi:hypothetical protein